MARLEYSGVPSVEPQLGAANDEMRIEATPGDFGAQVGQATTDLGTDLFKLQGFYDETAANDALNGYLNSAQSIMNGSPGKTVAGPDGQPMPDMGFLGLRGASAMSGFQGASESLDEAAQEARSGLKTLVAQKQFDADSRRYRAQFLNEMSKHANEQQFTWMADTNNTQSTIALNGVGAQPLNDATIADATQRVRQSYVRNAQLKGEDPAGALLKADQDVALTRIRSLLGSDDPKNSAAAEKVFEDSSGILGSLPNYDQIAHAVKGAVVNSQLGPETDQFLGTVMAGAKGAVAAPGAIVAPKGPVFDQIASAAASHGATPTETDFLQRSAQIESGGNAQAVNPAGTRFGAFQYPKTGPQSVEDQTGATLAAARTNAAMLTAAGVQPTEGSLYVMHQQGPAGGRALLTAPADINAVAALAPAYRGNVALATQAIAGNIGMPYRTPEQRQAANAAAANMTAGQFTGMWQRRFGEGTFPSTADALRASLPDTISRAQAYAEQQWPQYPDVQERFVSGVERRLNLTISQQDQQYLVDTHVVQSAMDAGKPISEQGLVATSPQVAEAWTRMQTENPLAAAGVQRMFDANARGAAAQFGVGFKGALDRVLAPEGDPTRIKDPSGLWPQVGSGPDATLTNSGIGSLSALTKMRGSPQGEASAAQIRQFVDTLHGELTYSNPGVGRYDVQGEARYAKFMAVALPQIEAAQKAGTLGKALDPNSPDYIGKSALPFMRTRAQMMKDAVTDPAFSPGALTVQSLTQLRASVDNDAQWQEALKSAIAAGRLTRPVWDAYLATRATGSPAALGSQVGSAAGAAMQPPLEAPLPSP